MRQLGKKIAAVGFLAFLGLWVVGAVRGLALPYPQPLPMAISLDRQAYSQSLSANNMKQLKGLADTPLPMVLDGPDVDKIRIHEKRAVLTSNSAAFDDDTAKVHSAVQAHNAEIFGYSKSGIEPGRKVSLEIGVQPDKFDALVESLRTIGALASISIDQKDRTDELRKLHGQRKTLQKNLEGIKKLREGKALSLEEALRLEQKLQDLEEKLESVGAQLGGLLGKESYYHVHVTLVEHQPGDRRDRTYTMPQRIGHAFLWAVAWWLGVALAASLAVGVGVSGWVLKQ